MRLSDIAGVAATMIFISILIYFLLNTPINAFSASLKESTGFLGNFSNISWRTGRYLWGERVFDLIPQVLLIFSATICILTLLGRGE